MAKVKRAAAAPYTREAMVQGRVPSADPAAINTAAAYAVSIGAVPCPLLVTKGATAGHLFFTTANCQKTYEELRAKGVEITEEPTKRDYGIDCGLRDPFGNHIRFMQPLPVAASA